MNMPVPPQMGGLIVRAEGPYAHQAQSLYTLFLHGPDELKLLRATGQFDPTLTCIFSNLPSGRYWVTADTKAEVNWPVIPSRAEAVCQPPGLTRVVIQFGVGDSGPSVRDHRFGEGEGGVSVGESVRDHRGVSVRDHRGVSVRDHRH